jgi:hypothetical protein
MPRVGLPLAMRDIPYPFNPSLFPYSHSHVQPPSFLSFFLLSFIFSLSSLHTHTLHEKERKTHTERERERERERELCCPEEKRERKVSLWKISSSWDQWLQSISICGPIELKFARRFMTRESPLWMVEIGFWAICIHF